MTDNAPKHPGRTPAQRRVLDAIGCGNNSPRMVAAVRDAMLKAGLIVEIEPRLIFGRFMTRSSTSGRPPRPRG